MSQNRHIFVEAPSHNPDKIQPLKQNKPLQDKIEKVDESSTWGFRMMMTGFEMGMNSGISMIIGWVLIIGISIWLLTTLFPKTDDPFTFDHESEDALSILKRRYASGELSKEEFETLRRHLEQS